MYRGLLATSVALCFRKDSPRPRGRTAALAQSPGTALRHSPRCLPMPAVREDRDLMEMSLMLLSHINAHQIKLFRLS